MKKPFWKRTNVVIGLALVCVGYFIPIIIAMISPETSKLLENDFAIQISQFKKFTVHSMLIAIGFVVLLWPKLVELGIFKRFTTPSVPLNLIKYPLPPKPGAKPKPPEEVNDK